MYIKKDNKIFFKESFLTSHHHKHILSHNMLFCFKNLTRYAIIFIRVGGSYEESY